MQYIILDKFNNIGTWALKYKLYNNNNIKLMFLRLCLCLVYIIIVVILLQECASLNPIVENSVLCLFLSGKAEEMLQPLLLTILVKEG